MSLSRTIYENLCYRGKNRLVQSSKEIHRHHIIPKHNGGTDDESNITYLTIREHQIAHYLLWRMNQNPNDLRAYYMLGANLTSDMRKEIGLWCVENEIGIFNPSYKANEVKKSEWKEKSLLSIRKQMEQKIGIFDPTKIKYHASLGGKEAAKHSVWQYWCGKEGRKARSSKGAKAHKGKRAMYDPSSNDKTFHRVPSERWEEFLSKGFIFGSPIKSRLGARCESKRKKKVTDGITTYESLTAAAKAEGVTPGAINLRIKSKTTSWAYISDI